MQQFPLHALPLGKLVRLGYGQPRHKLATIQRHRLLQFGQTVAARLPTRVGDEPTLQPLIAEVPVRHNVIDRGALIPTGYV